MGYSQTKKSLNQTGNQFYFVPLQRLCKKPTIFFLVGVLCSDTLAPLFDEAKTLQKYTSML